LLAVPAKIDAEVENTALGFLHVQSLTALNVAASKSVLSKQFFKTLTEMRLALCFIFSRLNDYKWPRIRVPHRFCDSLTR